MTEIPKANLGFLTTPSSNCPRAIETMIDNRNGNINVLGANHATSGCA